VDRRRFEHLFAELSVTCGRLLPRFRLWLFLREHDADPEALSLREALDFCDEGVVPFLAAEGLSLSRWQRRKLRRAISGFDPALTTPAEILERLDGENA
jgi:hypothetical protein